MRTLVIVFIFVFSPIINLSLYSQEIWHGEFRPVLNFPVGDEEIKTGYGFGLSVGYRFMPHVGAYAGWGWNQFKWDVDFSNSENSYDLEETGYSFGLQIIHPLLNSSKISYLIRFGGIYNHIEIENSEGNLIEDSGHGLGWEAGAGVELGIGMNWFMRPQLGYRSLKRTLETGGVSRDFDLDYLNLGVGMARKF